MTNKMLITETASLGTVAPDAKSGKFLIQIIEGDRWGSSGYYPGQVIEKDGPRVFGVGTQMYLNHPSLTEEYDQPERRVEDLIGVISSTPVWDDGAKTLTAEATIFTHYAPMIKEIMSAVGVSIRAYATAEEGEVEGRYGPIITGFISAESVDVVTKAGAGGAILSAIESAVGRKPAKKHEEVKMAEANLSPEQATALTTAMQGLADELKLAREARNKKTEEVDPLAVAQEVTKAVAEAGLPAVMHTDVFAAVRGGKDVAEAVRLTKERYEEITKSVSKTDDVQVNVKSAFEISEAALNAALLGK